jgi:hypothetical protein
MTVFTEAATRAESDGAFRQQVLMAMFKTALAVAVEDPTIENHVQRADLAISIVADPYRYQTPFALSVAANPGVGAGATDSDIEYTVTQVWNAHARIVTTLP